MHSVTLAEIEKFLIQGGIVSDREWDRVVESAQVEGIVQFEALGKELQKLPVHWESETGETSRLTTYHRKLLLKLYSGRSLSFPGARIGNFLLLEPMAVGGQGRAYRACEITPAYPSQLRKVRLMKSGRPGDRRLHEREAVILKQLNSIGCLRVPKFYASGIDRTRPYLVMSFRKGGDLRKFIKQHGPVSIAEAVHVTSKLIDTLRMAHRAGILHRDIKPSNLIYDREKKQVSIIDWGLGTIQSQLASDLDPFGEADQLSHSGTKLGTFTWMSPEHFRSSQDIVSASDLYAVGCVLFYMLTGEAPFRGSGVELMYDHNHSPRPLVSERLRSLNNPDYKKIPLQIDQLVFKLMSVNVADRPDYSTCFKMLNEAVLSPRSSEPAKPVVQAITNPSLEPPQKLTQEFERNTATDQDDTDEGGGKLELKDGQDRYAPFPNRSIPTLVNPDYISKALPSFYDLSQMRWPEQSESEAGAFLKTLEQQRQQFGSAEHVQKAADLQKLAFEKARYDNWPLAIEQWQTAWLWTPWDTTLKKHYLNVLREREKRPRSISVSIPKPSTALRHGNVYIALKESEAALRKNPWSTDALWQQAMAMDLLGYWNACNNLVELLIKTHFEFQEKPVHLLVLSSRVAARVGDLKRARRLLNAITTIDDRYAKSSEFHDLVNSIEAEMHTLVIKRFEGKL